MGRVKRSQRSKDYSGDNRMRKEILKAKVTAFDTAIRLFQDSDKNDYLKKLKEYRDFYAKRLNEINLSKEEK